MMKTIIFIFFSFTNLLFAQTKQDSIFGKPKHVKEYVEFINDSHPFTFMQGDDEYGHAVIMTPQNLRKRMRETWFTSDFCRYINNETYYDINRKITNEIWYYRSGEIVGDYNYYYDNLGRLIDEKSKNSYFTIDKKYYYKGDTSLLKFIKYTSKFKDTPARTKIDNLQNQNFVTSEYNSLQKIDSVYAVTNFIWKKIKDDGYQEVQDSIFRKRLIQVNYYGDNYQIKMSKTFDYKTDYDNKQILLTAITEYEYDALGRIIKQTQRNDDKYHYFILENNGKYREEIKDGGFASSSSTEYHFLDNGNLESKAYYSEGNLTFQTRFVYKKNLIDQLYYYDAWRKKKDDLTPTLIIFKYKFDKYKNWTECIKNVDGKDLYVWKREIQYY